MSTKRDLRWQGYYSVSTNWDWGIFQCPQNEIRVKFYVHIYGYIIRVLVVILSEIVGEHLIYEPKDIPYQFWASNWYDDPEQAKERNRA